MWWRSRAHLRARRGATLLLIAVLGLSSGAVLTAAAGARRTASAYGRFLAAAHQEDLSVDDSDERPPDMAAIAKLPEVADVGQYVYEFIDIKLPRSFAIVPFAALDDHAFRTIDRGVLLAGRRPNPGAPLEVAISTGMASRRHLRPGSRIPAQALTNDDAIASFASGIVSAHGPRLQLTVTGIVRQTNDLVYASPAHQDAVMLPGPEFVYLTPGFVAHYITGVLGNEATATGGGGVRLKHGRRDLPAFLRHARVANGGRPITIVPQSITDAQIQRALRIQALALLAFAVVAGASTIVVLGQALVRQLQTGSDDAGVLAALGMTRTQIFGAPMVEAGAIGSAGAAIAVAVAVAGSTMMPVGFARGAEPHLGIDVDVTVLGIGAGAVVLLTVARAAGPAWRAARRSVARPVRARAEGGLVSAVSRIFAGGPIPLVTGLRMALQRRGRETALIATSVIGVAIAVGALLATLTFGVSLASSASSPRRYGWTWDLSAGNPRQFDTNDEAIGKLTANRDVAAFAQVAFRVLPVGTSSVGVVAIDSSHGRVGPPVVAGRQPRKADEVALGSNTLRRYHRQLGDSISVGVGSNRTTYRIVGQLIRGFDLDGDMPLDTAVMTVPGLGRVYPNPPLTTYFIKLRPGVDRTSAVRRLRRDFGYTVLTPFQAPDLQNLFRIGRTPSALALLLGLLGAAAFAHALALAVGRARKDLAIFKTLGFLRSQVSASVAWQATTLSFLALAGGIPIGLVAGRWAWRTVADQIGIDSRASLPGVALVLTILGTFALANLAAAGPAWRARVVRPAEVLRSE